MSCTKVRERLEAHVDGMLAAAERAEIERHLAGCADCAKEARALRALDEALAASPAREPSPGFEASFLRRLRAEPEAESEMAGARAAIYEKPALSWWERLFGGWRGYAFAGAGVAAAVAIALLVWPSREGGVVSPDRPGANGPALVAAEPELLRRLDLLRNLEVATHLDAVEGLTDEELEAVSEMPGLGG